MLLPAAELLAPAAAVGPLDATWAPEGAVCVLAVGGAVATIGGACVFPVAGEAMTAVVLERATEGVAVVVVIMVVVMVTVDPSLVENR